MTTRWVIGVALAAALVVGVEGSTAATADSLDPSFGNGGIVTISSPSVLHASGGTVQPDGKPIVVGWYTHDGTSDLFLARLNLDGSLDSSFGNGGEVITDVGNRSFSDLGQTVAVQPDGKILVGGFTRSGTTYYSIVARYNADGSVDTSFGRGSGYTQLLDPDTSGQEITGIAIQNDGKIDVVSDGFHGTFTLYRLSSSGDWLGQTDVGGVGVQGYSVLVQPNGLIIVGGSANGSMKLWRFGSLGNRDDSFDGTGVPPGDDTMTDPAYGLLRQSDGKLVLAGGRGLAIGHGSTSNEAFALERFNSDGTLDTTFGTGGLTETQLGPHDDEAEWLLQEPDGKLVAVGVKGTSETNTTWFVQAAAVRYSADGVLDTSYGVNGVATTSLGGVANGAAMLDDGRFYAFATGGGAQVLRFTAGAPAVSFSPSTAAVGDVVHVTTSNLMSAATVQIGTVTVPGSDVTVVSPTQLDVTVPDGAVSGKISVTTVNGTGISAASLGVVPTIDAVGSAGPLTPGDTLGITGHAFSGTTSVTVGGAAWRFTVDSSTHITATVPAAAASGLLSITNAGGTTSAFTIRVVPIIASFAPARATAGQPVTITGVNLAGASVTFQGRPAVVESSTATSVVADLPPDAVTGPIGVTNADGDTGASATAFVPVPTLGPPGQAAQGDQVSLAGNNLGPVTAVTFRGRRVPFTQSSSRLVYATVPAATNSGAWAVTTAVGTATTGNWWPAPAITSFSPSHGRPGTTVAVVGSGMLGVQRVTIGGVAASFRFVSPARISVRVPAGASSGHIAIVGPGGTGQSAGVFTVDP